MTGAPVSLMFLLAWIGLIYACAIVSDRRAARRRAARTAAPTGKLVRGVDTLERLDPPWYSPVRCPHHNLKAPELCADCGFDPRYLWLEGMRSGGDRIYIRGCCRHLETVDIVICEWAPWLHGGTVGRICTTCRERFEEPE